MALKSDEAIGPYEAPLDQMMTYRLSRVYAQLNAQAARILKESSGLSQVQWRVLVMIDSFGAITANQIVRQLLMDKGQLSRTIKGMVESGLITSKENESDSRQHLLSMTETGRRLYEKARPAMRARQSNLIKHLTAQEHAAVLSALDKLELATREAEGKEVA